MKERKKMKRVLSLLVALGILMSFIPGAFAQNSQTVWSFDEESDVWTVTNSKGTASVANGVMTLTVSATNCAIYKGDLQIDGSESGMLHIRMKNNTANPKLNVMWATETKTTLTEDERCIKTEYYTGNDADFIDYYVDLSGHEDWAGNIITKMQLYLTAYSTSSGTVEIDTIEFIKATDDCEIAGFSDKLVYSTANEILLGLDTNLSNIVSVDYFKTVNKATTEIDTVTTSPFNLNATFTTAGDYSVGAKVTTDNGIFIAIPKSLTVHNAGKNRWSFESGVDGLKELNSRATLTTDDGVLAVNVNANQTNIVLESEQFGSTSYADYDYFKINMKNNTSKTGSLRFFARPVNSSFSDTYRFVLDGLSVNDTEFKEYTIALTGNTNWNIDFYQIRVTPASQFIAGENGQTAAFEIKSISLEADPQIVINELKTTKEAVEGTAVTIAADAADFDNDIKSVEFFEDGKSVGTDNTYPYAITYIPSSSGKKVITAVATDETDHTATSESVTMNVACDVNTVVTNISTQWNFNITGNTADFGVNSTAAVSQSNGKLVCDITGKNGYLLSPVNLTIDGTKYPYVHIRLKNNTGDNTHVIYWTTEADATFNDEKSITSTDVTVNDEDFVEYVYDLSKQWSGETITRLRFMPAKNATTGSVEIDYIKICDQPVVYYENNTINIEKESPYSVKATVTLNQPSSESGNIYLAHYVDDALASVSMKPFTSTRNVRNVETISLSTSYMKTGDKVRAFIFDDNLKPVLVSSEVICIDDSMELYAQPYWSGNMMYNETVTPIFENGSTTFNLMYEPNGMLSIRSHDLTKQYQEGIDYTIDGRTVTFLNDEGLFKKEDVYPTTWGDNTYKETVGGGYTIVRELNYYNSHQLVATYSHDGQWTGDIPQYKGDLLPNTMQKLNSKQPITVLHLGDSISTGANMSGVTGSAPWIKRWGNLTADEIGKKFGCDVNYVRNAKGGTTTEWGKEAIKESLEETTPDLVIIAFGMNDGSDVNMPTATFISNIEEMMASAKTTNPNAEFILVSTTLPNENLIIDGKSSLGTQKEQEAELLKLEKEGVAVAPVSSVHKHLLTLKPFVDMTGNNLNHVNDFTGRIYVQTIMSLLTNPAAE